MDGKIIFALGGFIVIIILGALYMQEFDFEGAKMKAIAAEEQLAANRHEIEATNALLVPVEKRNDQLVAALQLVLNRDELKKPGRGCQKAA